MSWRFPFFAAGILLAAAPLGAQTAVSPSRLELAIGERPVSDSIRVFNYSKYPAEVEVSVVHWDLDEHNEVRVLPPTEQSLDQWIVVNPLRFTIPAGRSQTVRFSIRPRLRPEPGEHRAMIFFNQLPDQSRPGVKFLFRVGVAIYGHVGEVTRDATLHGVEVAGTAVRLDVSNEGTANTRFEGQYAVWPAAAFPGTAATALIDGLGDVPAPPLPEPLAVAGPLPSTPVLPGCRRTLVAPLAAELAPGDYVLDLNGSLGGRPLDRAFPFSVKAGDAG